MGNGFDFSDYEEIIKSNFYSDDFAHMMDLESPDLNGNTATFRSIASDKFFDDPDDLGSDDDFF